MRLYPLLTLRGNGSFFSQTVVWALLLCVLATPVLPIFDTDDSDFSAGLFDDDDDDDGSIAAVSSLHLKLVALPPPPPPELPRIVVGLLLVRTERRVASVTAVPSPSRSPPLA